MAQHLPVVICPGMHPFDLTRGFLETMEPVFRCISQDIHVLPTNTHPPFCAVHILGFLGSRITPCGRPVICIAYSAGVVGATAALSAWQLQGGQVKLLIAVDGWGVPTVPWLPVYRLSHDYFTHWSSLGPVRGSFWADPGVGHHQIWAEPDQCWGRDAQTGKWCSAAGFIAQILR